MSASLAVFHGHFGRVCLYSMDRRMVPHGHREGHLIFHVQGPPARSRRERQGLAALGRAGRRGQPVAGALLQSAAHARTDSGARALHPARRGFSKRRGGRRRRSVSGGSGIEVTDHLSKLVFGTAQAMIDPEGRDILIEDRLCALTQFAFDQSWQWTPRGAEFTGPDLPGRDFRIRKALKYLQGQVGEAIELDSRRPRGRPVASAFLQAFPRAGRADAQSLSQRAADGARDRPARRQRGGGRGYRLRSGVLQPGEFFAVLHQQRRRSAVGLPADRARGLRPRRTRARRRRVSVPGGTRNRRSGIRQPSDGPIGSRSSEGRSGRRRTGADAGFRQTQSDLGAAHRACRGRSAVARLRALVGGDGRALWGANACF